MNRMVILDTETTGLDPKSGHRIIEIGCIEVIDRQVTDSVYHVYINPQRKIDPGAMKVHGITNEFVADKPLFKDIANEFFEFIKGAELVIHNAPFDVGFMDAEFARLQDLPKHVNSFCTITDTLAMARKKHPGQKNNLDALCKRYKIDNSNRELHGALLDSELLARVYLAMTGGQGNLFHMPEDGNDQSDLNNQTEHTNFSDLDLTALLAKSNELEAHMAYMEKMQEAMDGQTVWQQKEEQSV